MTNEAASPAGKNKHFALGIIFSVVLNFMIAVGGIIWVVSEVNIHSHNDDLPFYISSFALFANLVLVPVIMALAGRKQSAKGYGLGSAVFVGFVLVLVLAGLITRP